MTDEPNRTWKYAVGLSYPSEQGVFAKDLYEALHVLFPGSAVFFDIELIDELAGKDLGEKLRRVYREECALVVPLFCREYEKKEWCQLEWDAISELLLERREDRVIPVALDDTSIPNWTKADLAIRRPEYTLKEIASAIRKIYENRVLAPSAPQQPHSVTQPTDPIASPPLPEPAPVPRLDPVHPGRVKLREQVQALLEDRQLLSLLLTANQMPPQLTAEALSVAVFAVTPAPRPRPEKRSPMCFAFNAGEYLRKQQIMDKAVLKALKSLAEMLLPVSVIDDHPDAITRPAVLAGTTQRIAADDPRIGAAIVARNIGIRVWLENDQGLIVEDAVFASDGRDGIRERSRGGIPIDGIHAAELLESLCQYLAKIPALQCPTERTEDIWARLEIWQTRGAFVTVLLMNKLPNESLAAVQEALPQLILLQADGSAPNTLNSLVLSQLQEIDRLILNHRGPQP